MDLTNNLYKQASQLPPNQNGGYTGAFTLNSNNTIGSDLYSQIDTSKYSPYNMGTWRENFAVDNYPTVTMPSLAESLQQPLSTTPAQQMFNNVAQYQTTTPATLKPTFQESANGIAGATTSLLGGLGAEAAVQGTLGTAGKVLGGATSAVMMGLDVGNNISDQLNIDTSAQKDYINQYGAQDMRGSTFDEVMANREAAGNIKGFNAGDLKDMNFGHAFAHNQMQALKGAGYGASIGSTVGTLVLPGLGSAAGAVAGAGIGAAISGTADLVSNLFGRRKARRKANALNAEAEEAQNRLNNNAFNAINTVAQTQASNAMSNFKAYGGNLFLEGGRMTEEEKKKFEELVLSKFTTPSVIEWYNKAIEDHYNRTNSLPEGALLQQAIESAQRLYDNINNGVIDYGAGRDHLKLTPQSNNKYWANHVRSDFKGDKFTKDSFVPGSLAQLAFMASQGLTDKDIANMGDIFVVGSNKGMPVLATSSPSEDYEILSGVDFKSPAAGVSNKVVNMPRNLFKAWGMMNNSTPIHIMNDFYYNNPEKFQDPVGIIGGEAGAQELLPGNAAGSEEYKLRNNITPEPEIKLLAEGGSLREINAGGTHEENPLGGVPQGVGANGQPNLVEEGEVIHDDYVFSNRLPLSREEFQNFGIKGKRKGLTYAEAAKEIMKESENRPNDPYSKESVDIMLNRLAESQESYKRQQQANELAEAIKQNPELGEQLMQAAQMQEQQAMQEQAAQEQQMMGAQQQEQMMMQDPAMQEQMMSQQGDYQPAMLGEGYAYGGNLFLPGGDMPIYARNSPSAYSRYASPTTKPVLKPLDFTESDKAWPQEANDFDNFNLSNLELRDTPIAPKLQPLNLTINDSWQQRADRYNNRHLELRDSYIPKLKNTRVGEGENDDYDRYPIEYNDTSLMYAPVAANAINAVRSFLPADYSNANAIANSTNNQYQYVDYNPIGEKLAYNPVDREYLYNRLNSQANANRNAILASNTDNGARATAALLANQYNQSQALGNAFYQGQRENEDRRQKTAAFNAEIDKYNSQAAMQASLANQRAQQVAEERYSRALQQAAALREQIDSGRQASISSAITGLGTSLKDIGLHNYNDNQFKYTSSYLAPSSIRFPGETEEMAKARYEWNLRNQDSRMQELEKSNAQLRAAEEEKKRREKNKTK